jgi:hypothetical protein
MKENGRDSSCGERRKSIRLLPFSIQSKQTHFTLNLVVYSRSKEKTLGGVNCHSVHFLVGKNNTTQTRTSRAKEIATRARSVSFNAF